MPADPHGPDGIKTNSGGDVFLSRGGGSPLPPAETTAEDDRIRKIVHDLRSPLSSMRIWVHLLKQGGLSPEHEAHAIDSLDRSVLALGDLIARALPDCGPVLIDP